MSATLEVTILGCGSSTGIPRLGGPDGGGDWGVCDPANPKNRRRRCSILVRQHDFNGTTTVLVDTAPDMREQLLDCLLYTSDAADDMQCVDLGGRRIIKK